jgi:hypothetical protein
MLAAAVLDSVTDSLDWSRGLTIALAAFGVVAVVGHLAAILRSRRLK